jgi:hypothetical protein
MKEYTIPITTIVDIDVVEGKVHIK